MVGDKTSWTCSRRLKQGCLSNNAGLETNPPDAGLMKIGKPLESTYETNSPKCTIPYSGSPHFRISLITDQQHLQLRKLCSHDQDRSDIDGVSSPQQFLLVETGIGHRDLTLPCQFLTCKWAIPTTVWATKKDRRSIDPMCWLPEPKPPRSTLHTAAHCVYLQQLVQGLGPLGDQARVILE